MQMSCRCITDEKKEAQYHFQNWKQSQSHWKKKKNQREI